MEAKLIKTKVGYHLWLNPETKEQEHIASDCEIVSDNGADLRKYKLSLKNCQEIENGYDLDELADEVLKKHNLETFPSAIKVFKEGFQKALSILGDKKFSEEDIKKAMDIAINYELKRDAQSYQEKIDFLKSLQQTEWDVWLVMACGLPDGCTEPEVSCTCDIIPSLDADGCLILKRI